MTTVKDHTDTETLVDAATKAAIDAGSTSLATIQPDQQRWNEHQLAILRQLGVEDATQGDLDLFFHVCRTTGLDPFRKQIYMIGRNTKLTEWVDDDRAQNGRRKVEKWVTKYTIQTGIDGYRRNGREAAKRFGDTLGFDGPYWCGEDGQWRDVWPAKTPPTAAKFTVFRNGEPFSAVVHYDEFVQTNPVYQGTGQNRQKVGEEPNAMWDKMPRNQTAKCAEALAYRRAYPDDFAGLILEDAAQPTVIDPDGNVEQEPPRRPEGSGLAGVRAARERAQAIHVVQVEAGFGAGDTNQVETRVENATMAGPGTGDQSEPYDVNRVSPPDHPQRRKWLNHMFALFGKADIAKDNRDDRLIITRRIITRAEDSAPIESSNDLTDRELVALVTELGALDNAGVLGGQITQWLNDAALAELNTNTDKGETA